MQNIDHKKELLRGLWITAKIMVFFGEPHLNTALYGLGTQMPTETLNLHPKHLIWVLVKGFNLSYHNRDL